MTNVPPAPARRAHAAATPVQRSEIIAAATALFAGRGYHGTSMHDVGERVGLLKGSLYVHVANKEEMLLEIVSTMSRRIQTEVESVLTGTDRPAALLRLAIAAYVGIAVDNQDALTVFVHEGRHLSGQPSAWYEQARRRHADAWRHVFAEGVKVGEFRPDLDLETCTRVTMSACETCAWASGNRQHAGNLAPALADLVLDGCTRRARRP